MVLVGKRYLRRSALSSLRYQPPRSIAFVVRFSSSTASSCGGSVWARTSLMTTSWTNSAPGPPGDPCSSALAPQLAGFVGETSGSSSTSELPSPPAATGQGALLS